MVDLGDLAGGLETGLATGVSRDGGVVVGQSSSARGREAFRWTAEAGLQALGDLRGGPFESEARAVSADGAVVVGAGSTESGRIAFRWSAPAGLQSLGDLPGGEAHSEALAVSADGATVVGYGTTEAGEEAFLWTRRGGLRPLRDLLHERMSAEPALAAALEGWRLTRVTAISADGETLAGIGRGPDGSVQAWRIRLAPDATRTTARP